MTHHSSNHLAFGRMKSGYESFDSLRSLRISAVGSDARKAPQDAIPSSANAEPANIVNAIKNSVDLMTTS